MADGVSPRPLPRHRLEYAGLIGLGGLVRVLPHRASLALAWLVAAFLHFVVGFRRAEARRRLRRVLDPETPERAIRRAAWTSFRTLCFNAVDALALPTRSPEWFRAHVALEGRTDLLEECKTAGRGLILTVPHMGSWELVGVALQRAGFPFFFLARRQKNTLTDAYLNRLRATAGVPAMMNDDPGVLKQSIRRLRAGQFLGLLPDVRARTPAHPIPFLGGTANLGAGPALLARQSGARLVAARVERIGWTRHRITLVRAIETDPNADRDADARRVMTELMTCLEGFIRTQPEQYFWYNRRWVLDPLTPAESKSAAESPL